MIHLMLVTFISLFTTIPSFDHLGEDMYYGVENPIKILLNNCNPEEIQIKVNSGTLQKRSDSLYIFVPQSVNEEIKIKLYYKKILCEVKSFEIKNLPQPILKFELESEGNIKVQDLVNPGKLIFIYPEVYPESSKNRILSFSIVVNDHMGNPVYSATSKSDAFDENTLQKLSKLQAGSVISISNVIITNPYKGNSRYPIQKEIVIK